MARGKERFASMLKRELSFFLLRNFPLEPGIFLSVVDVAADSSGENVKVYVSVFPPERGKDVLKELKRSRGDARKYLSERIKRRKVPQISFLPVDTSEGERLEKLLEKVKNE